ncbi:transmembrane protein 72 [Salminus brasiliensis]|uniref:transmembrane protein 72 n=1 Tax=Salminus brasiliensis TaxID=930266 RepID=UPI003B82D96B
MGIAVFWVVVECACRVLGISTAAVLCAVGVETLREEDFHSLAVYLLVSSAGMMLFEVAYFTDALLETCLPCPPTCKFFIVWKKMANTGGFQKFLYYTIMSVVCFLHPVLVWHAVIPGTMLLVTGVFNFILSKKKKTSSTKQSSESYGDSALSAVCVNDSGETEQTYSFFHIISGRRVSFLPNNSRLQRPSASSHGTLEPDHPSPKTNDQRPMRKADRRNVQFVESFRQDETEMEEYDMEPEVTTSDKAPMIKV